MTTLPDVGELVIMVSPGKPLDEDERELLAQALPSGESRDVQTLRMVEDPNVKPGWAYLVELEDEHA